MKNNPNIKPTDSVIYFEPQISQDDKIKAVVDQAFLKFNKNRTGYMDKEEFKCFVKYAVEKGILRAKGKIPILEYLNQIERTWRGPISKKEVSLYVEKNFQLNQNRSPHSPRFSPNKKQNDGNNKKLIEQIFPIPKNPRYTKQEISEIAIKIFEKYDKNKTGFLDFIEMSNLLKNEFGGKYSYHDFIQMNDKDKDGMMDKTEIIKFIEKVYNQ